MALFCWGGGEHYDSAIISQVLTTVLALIFAYGATYFGMYKGLAMDLEKLAYDIKKATADKVVSPDEVIELQNDLADLQAEFEKLMPKDQ